MSVGTSIPLPAYTLDPAFMARTAESLGFESIWYAEHPILPVSSDSQFPSGGPIPWTYAHFADPYIALARASGATTTIKLGTGHHSGAGTQPVDAGQRDCHAGPG